MSCTSKHIKTPPKSAAQVHSCHIPGLAASTVHAHERQSMFTSQSMPQCTLFGYHSSCHHCHHYLYSAASAQSHWTRHRTKASDQSAALLPLRAEHRAGKGSASALTVCDRSCRTQHKFALSHSWLRAFACGHPQSTSKLAHITFTNT